MGTIAYYSLSNTSGRNKHAQMNAWQEKNCFNHTDNESKI